MEQVKTETVANGRKRRKTMKEKLFWRDDLRGFANEYDVFFDPDEITDSMYPISKTQFLQAARYKGDNWGTESFVRAYVGGGSEWIIHEQEVTGVTRDDEIYTNDRYYSIDLESLKKERDEARKQLQEGGKRNR